MRNTEGTSCHALIVPSRVGGVAPPPGAEILTRGAWGRHGHWSMGMYLFVNGDLLFQTIGTADPYQGSAPGSKCFFYPEDATTEIQDVRSQRHCRVVLSLVRELALHSSSSRPRKPHGTCIQLQSRLLAGVEQDDRGDRTGNLHSAPRAPHGPTQRAFHRRCSRYSHTERNKRSWAVEIRSQCASIRTAGRAPQVLPPPARRSESVLPEVISGSTPIASPQLARLGDFISAQAPTWRLLRGAVQRRPVRLAAEFASAGSSLVGTTSPWTLRSPQAPL